MKTKTTVEQAFDVLDANFGSVTGAEENMTLAQAQKFAKEYLELCKKAHDITGFSNPADAIQYAAESMPLKD